MAYGNFNVVSNHNLPTAHPEAGASRMHDGFGGAEVSRVAAIPPSAEVADHERAVAAKIGSIASEEALRQAALEQEAQAEHAEREMTAH